MEKNSIHKVTINDRDRLLHAWQRSMDMVRDFEVYSEEAEKEKYSSIFAEYAKDEGYHASYLRELLENLEENEQE